jgi:hypothetical protein
MIHLRVWIVIALVLSLWACGSPEQSTVDQFFRAAQTSDPTTLASMSAVGPPGKIDSWKVVEVTSRTTEPFTLPDLVAKLEAAKKERDSGQEIRKKYFDANKDSLEQIIPKTRDDPSYKFKGQLGAIQEEWDKMLAERNVQESAYQELKRTADREIGIVSKSVMRQLDVGTLHGAIEVTDMLLNLKPQDSAAELPFKVQLKKYQLSEAESDRVEPSRWIITGIEGATEEAKAVAAAAATAGRPAGGGGGAAVADAAASTAADSAAPATKEPAAAPASKEPAASDRVESDYVPRELRGDAKVQILAPETKVAGDEVVTTIRVRNVSKDWISGLTVTEHWYDQQGTAVGSGSRTHRERFMPGEVIEIQLKTRKRPDFYQSQYQFSHANGEVTATTVGSFPKQI